MIIFSFICAIFLLIALFNIFTMPKMKGTIEQPESLVSIAIPMRNEERNVAPLIASLKQLTHPSLEFVILNDQSVDGTAVELERAIDGDPRFRVIDGVPLPDGWVGKVHACHQLSRHTAGEYVLFLDADVRVNRDVIQQCFSLLSRYNSKLVTGFPRFPIRPLLGKLLVPFQHFFVFFHLPNIVANHTTLPAFTAAHGAFLFFEREAYDAMGGHGTVKNSLVEDIHIVRAMKRSGYRATLANVVPSVTCYMYDTNREVWNGFLKNIYVGIGRSVFSAMALILFYTTFFIVPFFLFCYGLATADLLPVIPLLLTMAVVFSVDIATKQNWYHFLLMPAATVALVALLITSIIHSSGRGYEWKGRVYK